MPIRVLVVDDSVVVRGLIRRALDSDERVEVCGTANDGRQALQKIQTLQPDLVTLDVEMPELDGLSTLIEIRKTDPDLPVIMFSSLTEQGAQTTLDCLHHGASDFVAKPTAGLGGPEATMLRIRDELVPKVVALTTSRRTTTGTPSDSGGPRTPTAARVPKVPAAQSPVTRLSAASLSLVVIGVSTGGPTALNVLLPALPKTFPLPILIVQHMPTTFTRLLSERLNDKSELRVREGADGMQAGAGDVVIAPGGHHMIVTDDGPTFTLGITDTPPENSCRPAVDALFRSASERVRGGILALMLTGMGHDGLAGTQLLKARGDLVIAQDEPTSVVWGMPGSVVNAGLADAILPLNAIANELIRLASRGHRAAVNS